jgi:adenylate cyclase class IV
MTIEVEKRGILTKKEYEILPKKIMALSAKDLGKNDTKTIFYAGSDAQLKVQVRNSKKQAKIAWKSGGFDGASSRKEIEVGIDFNDIKSAEHLIDVLMPTARKVLTFQKRHDFSVNGLTISVKYSEHWKYHVELDEVVNTEEEVNAALERIQRLASELNIKLLTQEEEKSLVAGILAKL